MVQFKIINQYRIKKNNIKTAAIFFKQIISLKWNSFIVYIINTYFC